MTRLGDFWKFSVTKFLTKWAQIASIYLGNILKVSHFCKTAVVTFRELYERLCYILFPMSGHTDCYIMPIAPGMFFCIFKLQLNHSSLAIVYEAIMVQISFIALVPGPAWPCSESRSGPEGEESSCPTQKWSTWRPSSGRSQCSARHHCLRSLQTANVYTS